jgi:hypothetical protein
MESLYISFLRSSGKTILKSKEDLITLKDQVEWVSHFISP